MKTVETKTLGVIVAAARKKKGLTLRELGKKTKLSYQTIARVEQDKGGFDAINRVLEALDFPVARREQLLNQVVHRLVAA